LWEETSCTAMFAYSIARAVNRGWIDATNMDFARKAFVALASRVKTNGVVTGTCEGTNIGTTLGYYAGRTQPDDDWHGPGPVMLAGVEILQNPKLNVIRNGAQTTISWPSSLTNATLQRSTNLIDWTAYGGALSITNWQNIITNAAQDIQFFRL